jgi:hypothetical protein
MYFKRRAILTTFTPDISLHAVSILNNSKIYRSVSHAVNNGQQWNASFVFKTIVLPFVATLNADRTNLLACFRKTVHHIKAYVGYNTNGYFF